MLDTGPVLLNSFDTSGTLTGIPRSWIIIMIRVKKNINRILKNNKITTTSPNFWRTMIPAISDGRTNVTATASQGSPNWTLDCSGQSK